MAGRRIYVITPQNRITAFDVAELRNAGGLGGRSSVNPGVARRFELIRTIRSAMSRLTWPGR